VNILNISFIARTRRNHALEHATIHVLSQHRPGINLVGRSTPNGYYIYGSATTEQVRAAANEALARLKAGEHRLAIHPGCGTNLVASGTLAGASAFVAMSGRSKRWDWDRLPAAMLATMAALIVAQPLGPLLQEHVTTSPDVGDLTITGVQDVSRGQLSVHKVSTRS
jgi:uncharacterized membrane protein